MPHIRKDSTKPTVSISLSTEIFKKVDDYRFENRKENRSQAIEELIRYGFKYLELLEKKKKAKAEKSHTENE